MDQVGSVVLPGDLVHSLSADKCGRGLIKDPEDQCFVVSSAGYVRHAGKGHFWVQTAAKRYFPQVGDQIVGIIEDKGGEYYRVNIFGPAAGILGRLAFEGATKRNQPDLHRGDVVYARVVVADPELETELSCTSSTGPKKEWSSGETIFGELREGQLVHVSSTLMHHMLEPKSMLLHALGKHISYEVTVGVNGAVWFKTDPVLDAIVLRNAFVNADYIVKTENYSEDGTISPDCASLMVAMVEKLVVEGRKKGEAHGTA